jgi:hypothetical protein
VLGRHQFDLSAPMELRSIIETWANHQKDKSSRSEAIRRLIEIAPGDRRKKRTPMK